jgi:hypothetical protein
MTNTHPSLVRVRLFYINTSSSKENKNTRVSMSLSCRQSQLRGRRPAPHPSFRAMHMLYNLRPVAMYDDEEAFEFESIQESTSVRLLFI